MEKVSDYMMYEVGNRWEYQVTTQNNGPIGYKVIEVVADSLAEETTFKKLSIKEHDLEGNLVEEKIEYKEVDPDYNYVDGIYKVDNRTEAYYLGINSYSFERSEILVNGSSFDNYKRSYHKYLGLKSFSKNDGEIGEELIAATIGDISYGTSDIDESNVNFTFKLHQNYPNPFNPTTTIQYSLPNSMGIKIFVYNVAGKVVFESSKITGMQGNNSFKFNGSKLSSGQYFYQIVGENRSMIKKMLLLK